MASKITRYKDYKNNVHTVTHRVILSDADKRELEDKIVDDLCRIFDKH